MSEFNALKSSARGDDKVLKFFAEIDEGLKAYNENVDLLSRGA